MGHKNNYKGMQSQLMRTNPQAGVIFKNYRAVSYFYDDVTTYRVSRISYDEENFIQFYELETVEKMFKFLEYVQCILRIPEMEV